MTHCEKCKVDIAGSLTRCPLCQAPLTGTPDPAEDRYPVILFSGRPELLLLRLILFASAAAAIICVCINLALPAGGFWAGFVVAGIACMWICFALMLKKRVNLPKSILWQATVFSGLAILWDYFTGWHGWSVDFVLPILCLCAMAAMALIARLARLRVGDYLIYMMLDCVFGILPLVLLLCGVLQVVIPSVICIAGSALYLAALFIFEGETLLSEIVRRLHL